MPACHRKRTIELCILPNYVAYCIAYWIFYYILDCILHYILHSTFIVVFSFTPVCQMEHILLCILPNYIEYFIAYCITYCIVHSSSSFLYAPMLQETHHITLHIAKLHWVLHISLHIALYIEYHVIYSSRPYVAGNAPYYFAYCIAYCSCLLFADEHSGEDEETNADDAKQAV